jgi:flagellar hook assembly protein FlgD
VLVDEVQSAGNYRVEWDGTSDGSSKVATGIYFYRLSYGDNFQTRKMVLLK